MAPFDDEIRLLGIFQARAQGRAVALPHSCARLLAVVGLLGPLSRSEVAGTLWPETGESRAMANLRVTLSRLNAVEKDFLAVRPDALELREHVRLDVHDVLRWAHCAIYGAHPPGGEYGPPPEVGRGLLVGWDDDWLVGQRERVSALQAQALEAVAERLLAAGRPAEALPYALSAVRSQPWAERANRLVIDIHARRGDPSMALRQFREFRAALQRELGVEPGPDTVATIRRLYPDVPVAAATRP